MLKVGTVRRPLDLGPTERTLVEQGPARVPRPSRRMTILGQRLPLPPPRARRYDHRVRALLRRMAINLVYGLSLLVFVLAMAMWVRSYFVQEYIWRNVQWLSRDGSGTQLGGANRVVGTTRGACLAWIQWGQQVGPKWTEDVHWGYARGDQYPENISDVPDDGDMVKLVWAGCVFYLQKDVTQPRLRDLVLV